MIKLSDLPPHMQAQAIAKIKEQDKQRDDARKRTAKGRQDKGIDEDVRTAANADAPAHFDSKGEYSYYICEICPKLKSGDAVSCKLHPEFELFPKSEYCGLKLSRLRYTPDFMITYADGTAEIVEIKGRMIKKLQRDYHLRRRMFIEIHARPNGWKFKEVINE